MSGLALVATVATGLLAGCASAPRPVGMGCADPPRSAPAVSSALIPVEATAPQPSEPPWPVHFADPALRQRVQVQATFAGREPSGHALVSARLINCGAQDLTLRARVAFISDNGAPAEPHSAWQPVHLPAQSSAVYSERSTRTDAARQYLIEVGWGP